MELAGFAPLFVNELNSDDIETYLINRDREHPLLRSKYNSRDIKVSVSKEGFFDDLLDGFKNDYGRDFRENSVDLLRGGPPCQGFSGIGIRRSYSVDKVQLPSNHLFQDMAFCIHKVRPKMFMFENVEGLLRARWTSDGHKGEIFTDVLETFTNIPGYVVRHRLVYGKDYGVPQNRQRVLIVGIRQDQIDWDTTSADAIEAGFLPRPTGQYPHIEEIFSDLIDPTFQSGGETRSYPVDPLNVWQERYRSNPITGEFFRKGDPISDCTSSEHSRHWGRLFSVERVSSGVVFSRRFSGIPY
jgi:DNA (cytosine-5)-methyltransferase 1